MFYAVVFWQAYFGRSCPKGLRGPAANFATLLFPLMLQNALWKSWEIILLNAFRSGAGGRTGATPHSSILGAVAAPLLKVIGKCRYGTLWNVLQRVPPMQGFALHIAASSRSPLLSSYYRNACCKFLFLNILRGFLRPVQNPSFVKGFKR